MTLKELRKSYGLSQANAAKTVGIPLRTYIRYENNEDSTNLKYIKIREILQDKLEISETKGIYSLDKLKEIIISVLNDYKEDISFCYLFGSYSKGYPKEDSDVDVCVDTKLTGLKFVGLTENLHQALKKNVDVIRFSDLKNNLDLIEEIMKGGIKIYG